MADYDFSELGKLAADLTEAGADVDLRKPLNITSLKVKRAAQAKVGGRKNLSQAASAITFDVTNRKNDVESEIGYDKSRAAGKLGNLVEFGAPGATNSLTPGNELVSSLKENEGDFVKGVELAIDDALREAGL